MRYKVSGFAVLIVLLVGSVFASDWMVMTGNVTRVRQGKATFYTVIDQDGTEHLANSAHPHVGQNENVFKAAYEEKTPLYIEFRSHVNNPGSIWQIQRIEPVSEVDAAPAAPAPVVSPQPELPASVSVSGMFQDGMVLQREQPVPVWGWAPPGTEVSVEFLDQKKTVVTSASGEWQVMLDPMPASFDSRTMDVHSTLDTRHLTFSNVLIGDVWILAGQSNMEWWLGSSDGGAEAAAAANYPWLRYFTPGWQLPDLPVQDVARNASWQECSPKTAGQFSAIGFWMAEKLHQELNVPIGLIKNAVSGTYGECWVPREVLESIPAAQARLDEYQDALKILPQEQERWNKEKAEWETEAAEARKNGKPEPAKSFFVRKGPMGPDHFHRPFGLYNGLVAPLMPFAVRGVVWYQGEGNSQKHRAGYYEEILEGLVGSWRDGWNQERLPFLIVQLPKFEAGPHNDWPQVREAQRKATLALEDTDLVVTIDTGDPKQIHPTNKQPVAERVAAVVLQQVYGEPVVGCSPSPLTVEQTDNGIIIRFSNSGDGLVIRGNGSLVGFELAGGDDIFSPVEAELVGKDVVKLSCPAGFGAKTVRYAYANTPNVNLFSSDGLPVVPFVLPVQMEQADSGYGPDVPRPTFWDIPYGSHERNRLDFWQANTTEPAPLLIYIHGGSWLGNDRRMVADRGILEFCLSHGISVASIDYRYSSDAILPAPVHDAARAVQFIRSKAREWNLDKTRVLLQGGSAGGCSSLWIGLHDDLADPDSADPVARESTRVSGVIAQSGQTSIDPKVLEGWIGDMVWGMGMFRKAVGAQDIADFQKNYDQYKLLLEEFSPINHLDAGDPPVFLSYGGSEDLPPKDFGHGIHHPVLGKKMKEKADSVGQDCRLQINGSARELYQFYLEQCGK